MIYAEKYDDDRNDHAYLQIQPQKRVTTVTMFTLFSLPILSDFFSPFRTSINTPLKYTIHIELFLKPILLLLKPMRGVSMYRVQLGNFSLSSFLCVTFWIERHRTYTYFTHVTPRVKKHYFPSQSFSENEKFSLLIIGQRRFSLEIVVTQLFLSVGPLRDTFLLLLWKYFPQIQQPHLSWERYKR